MQDQNLKINRFELEVRSSLNGFSLTLTTNTNSEAKVTTIMFVMHSVPHIMVGRGLF